MKIPTPALRSLLAALLLVPALLPAVIVNPEVPKVPSDLLVKINFEVEWEDGAVPTFLDAAYRVDGDLVNRPPVSVSRYDAKVREAFVQRLTTAFKDKGYAGTMNLIDQATEAERGKPILVITLRRWALSAKDRFDCYFDARLVTPQGETDLGTHEYSDIKLNPQYVLGRNVGVEKATAQALGQFHLKLAESGQLALLPAGS